MTSNQEAEPWQDTRYGPPARPHRVHESLHLGRDYADAKYVNALEQALTQERQQAETWRDWKALVERAEADMTEALNQLNQERQQREAAETARYLPIECPNCGRMRLEYRPADKTANRLTCEKCYMDADALADCEPVEKLDALKQSYTTLLALVVEQRKALEDLRDVQNGPPLARKSDVEAWSTAYAQANAALATDYDSILAEAREHGIEVTG